MFHILDAEDQIKGAIAAVEFEGERYGAGISFFHGKLTAGQGPPMHKHDYPETCIVLSGRVAMTIDDREIVASAGTIVVIAPESLHSFTAIGEDPLEMLCIHESPRPVIQWLDDPSIPGNETR